MRVAGSRPEGGRGIAPDSDAHDAPATAPADPEAERERAREYLLRALTSSAKSRARLAQGLAERDIAPDIADEILDRFEEVGLIDDAQYAQTLVRTRFVERGLSRRALAALLREKGVSQHAEEALAQVDDTDELEAARRLVSARAARLSGLPEETRRRRLASYLGRKGYGSATAMQVIREIATDDR